MASFEIQGSQKEKHSRVAVVVYEEKENSIWLPGFLLQGDAMRELVFKNLTSKDNSKRIVCAREVINEEGITTRIDKHLIYAIREAIHDETAKKIKPELFIIKEKDTKNKKESFFVKMKGGLYANCNDKLLYVDFLHSLKIDLSPEQET